MTSDILKVPQVCIGLEYDKDESLLSVYIKSVFDLPPFIGDRNRECCARCVVIKKVRRFWLKSNRNEIINLDEVNANVRMDMETLSVRRERSQAIFNQWYCCELSPSLFHQCAIKIQFFSINKYSHKTLLAEADHWIDEKPIQNFTEYNIPLRFVKPDLGELEIGLCYLPTAQRISITVIQATNLKLQYATALCPSKILVKIHLLVANGTRERFQTELKESVEPCFNQIFALDLEKENELFNALLVFTVVEVQSQPSETSDRCDNMKEETKKFAGKKLKYQVGRIVLSNSFEGTEHTHWQRMLNEPRQKHCEVHKLCPC